MDDRRSLDGAVGNLARNPAPGSPGYESWLFAQEISGKPVRTAAREREYREWLEAIAPGRGRARERADSGSMPAPGSPGYESWLFAQQISGKPVRTAAEEREYREWLSAVGITREGAWDPSKHPRGGNPHNTGEFSSGDGAGGAAAGGKPAVLRTVADQVKTWYDANKSPAQRKIDSGNGVTATLKFEHVLAKHHDLIANRAQDALHVAAIINRRLQNGSLSATSTIVTQHFGALNKRDFEKLKDVFHQVVERSRKTPLTVEMTQSQPAGVPNANASTPTIAGVYHLARITLTPRFETLSQERQTAVYFHELTHIFGGTKDTAYFNPASPTGYVDRTGKPRELAPNERVKNASTYEAMVMDLINQHTGGKRNP